MYILFVMTCNFYTIKHKLILIGGDFHKVAYNVPPEEVHYLK